MLLLLRIMRHCSKFHPTFHPSFQPTEERLSFERPEHPTALPGLSTPLPPHDTAAMLNGTAAADGTLESWASRHWPWQG